MRGIGFLGHGVDSFWRKTAEFEECPNNAAPRLYLAIVVARRLTYPRHSLTAVKEWLLMREGTSDSK
jgi:hypothetical protein